MSQTGKALPPNSRWNFFAFLVDYVCFGVAFAFISPNSVLPAFVRQFTSSAPVIGLVTTVYYGSWLLPQLFTGRMINDKPRKKPYLIAGISGRSIFWLIALALWLGLGRQPTVMLLLFFVGLGLFAASDAMASVAWFDILARALSVERRGRLMGLAQCISGLAGLGVGALVTWILDSSQFSFPVNYTLIFALAGAVFVPSVVALISIREPPPEQSREGTKKEAKSNWLAPLTETPPVRLLILCRILVGMMSLATPFYVVHATDVLQLSQGIVGSFVAVQTLSSVAASVLLGLVCERWGPRYVIRIGCAVAITGPLFAMIVHLANGSWLTRAYPFVYVAPGVMQSAVMLGFYNYLLEIAPGDKRPSYIGLSNTILGTLTLAPTAGGWLLETTSYTVLFGVAASLIALGFLFTLRLRPPSQIAPAEGEA